MGNFGGGKILSLEKFSEFEGDF